MKFKRLGVRVLVAIVGIPAIIFLVIMGRLPFALFVATAIGLAQLEFYHMVDQKGINSSKLIGILFGVLTPALFYYRGIEEFWLLILIATVCILIVELFRNVKDALLNTAASIMGILYPALFFSFMVLIRELPHKMNQDYRQGAFWIIGFVAAVWVCDTAAYFIGSWIGRVKLFERVSPNKTVEGAVAGFIFAVLTGYLVHLIILQDVPIIHLIVVSAIAGSVGQFGDLVESLFKRDVGIKDSSNLLPGHGGVLDRFDSLFLVAPIVYLYIRFVIF